jgi:hypothetical protein
MSSSKDTKLIPLFGRLDDERSKFFVSLLRDAADKKRNGGKYIRMQTSKAPPGGPATHVTGNIYIKDLTTEFKNESFLPRVAPDDEISSEWVRYFTDVIARIYNKMFDKNNKLGREIIELIESVSNIASPGSEEEFTQEIIKILVLNMTKKAGVPAFNRTDPSTWTNIETVNYDNDTLKYLLKAPDAVYDPNNISFAIGHDDIVLLGNNFTDCYNNIDGLIAAGGIGALDSLKTTFNYNYNKYFIRKMLEEHAKTAKQPINNSTSILLDDNVIVEQEKYFRKGGILYTKNDKGEDVRVDRNSPAYAELHNDPNKCLDTGFKDNNTLNEKCSDYLRDCLMGKNIDKCKTFLQKPDYWTNVKDELDDMLPVTAVDTLRSFQFDFISVDDKNLGRKINKVITVEKWIEKLHVLSKTPKPKEAQVDQIVTDARNAASALGANDISTNAAGLAARKALLRGVDYNVALTAGENAAKALMLANDIVVATVGANAAVALAAAQAEITGAGAIAGSVEELAYDTVLAALTAAAAIGRATAATVAAAGNKSLKNETTVAVVNDVVTEAERQPRTGAGTQQILTLGEVNKISSNNKLIDYLKMLVTKINSNPAILNSDYVNPNDTSSISKINNSFEDSYLARKGVKARLAPRNSITRLSNLFQQSNDNLRLRFNIGPFSNVPVSFVPSMRGGNNTVIKSFEDSLSNEIKRTSNILANHHNGIKTRLKLYGKEIDPNDNKKIEKLIEQLDKSEEKLYTASLYAEKYAQLLELHGEKDDNNSILTYNHLKEFVDNRNKIFNRVTKKQDDLLSVMKALIDIAVKEELQSKPGSVPEKETKLNDDLFNNINY